MPRVAVLVAVDYVDAPEVLRGHGYVVVDVTGNFLVLWGHWCGYVVRIERSACNTFAVVIIKRVASFTNYSPCTS